jgi:putative ABC transport system substrate-binding protein
LRVATELIVLPNVFTSANRETIIASVARYRLPAIFPYNFFAQTGGLISYGVDFHGLFRGAAKYIDRILNGASTSSLPVQQPVKFDLVVNLKTAKALGLTIPCNAFCPRRRGDRMKRRICCGA